MEVILRFINDLEEIKKCLGPITDNKTRDLINEKLYTWENEVSKFSNEHNTGYDNANVKFDEHETTTSIDKKYKANTAHATVSVSTNKDKK